MDTFSRTPFNIRFKAPRKVSIIFSRFNNLTKITGNEFESKTRKNYSTHASLYEKTKS